MEEAMARSESFEEFYTGTVGRLLGQLFVVTGDLPLPVGEVAHTLDMPHGTVKSLLSRGRQALAAKLGEAEEVLDPS